MGSNRSRDTDTRDDETPEYVVPVSSFQIAKYPLTVAEYDSAVRSRAVREPRELAGLDWRTQQENLDHPVVCVTRTDAQEYAEWFSEKIGELWRLPTEVEWEKAARGRDARTYPWGDSWQNGVANTYEEGKGATTPVGSYPRGAAECGAFDMSGNVWEWTSSVFQLYPDAFAGQRGSQDDSAGDVVLRGGSWYSNFRAARAACRYVAGSSVCSRAIGFRLVRDVWWSAKK